MSQQIPIFNYIKAQYGVDSITVDLPDPIKGDDAIGQYCGLNGGNIRLHRSASLGTLLHEVGHHKHLRLFHRLLLGSAVMFLCLMISSIIITNVYYPGLWWVFLVELAAYFAWPPLLYFIHQRSAEWYADRFAHHRLRHLMALGVIPDAEYFQPIPATIDIQALSSKKHKGLATPSEGEEA